jgi:predicted phage terminase large subunit-like protein
VAFQSLFFKDLMKDKKLANTAMIEITPDGDKVMRARPLQTRAKQGKVKLVRGLWNQAFIQEAQTFPGGAHDDQVDTASGGLAMLADEGWVSAGRRY